MSVKANSVSNLIHPFLYKCHLYSSKLIKIQEHIHISTDKQKYKPRYGAIVLFTAIRGAISRVVVNRILCNMEFMFTGFHGY